MNAIVSIVTAASVLVHTALGCCIEHSHSASVGCVAPSAIRPAHKHAHSCGHSHSHDHDGADSEGDHPEWPHKHCDEGACTAVMASKTGPQFEAVTAAFDVMPSVDALHSAGNSAPFVDYSSFQHDLGPPLRPHLCFCVLLI